MAKRASFSELEAAFKKKRFDPVYFFHGQEEFFIEELIALAKQTLFSDEMAREMNTSLLYGQESSLGDIASLASSYPMFAERRLVVVRGFDRVRKESTKEKQAAQLAAFAAYLQQPLETTTLILTAGEIDKKDLAKEPYALLESVRYEFPALKDVAGFVDDYAKRFGWRFAPDALNLFVTYGGTAARELGNEIDKLILYAGERDDKTFTYNDVAEVVGVSREYTVFELQKALAEGNVRQASGIALMMLKDDSPVPMINALTVFFMRLWKLKTDALARMSDADAAKELGMFGGQSYFLRDYKSYAQKFSQERIERAMLALHDADLSLKGITTQTDEHLLALTVIHRILS